MSPPQNKVLYRDLSVEENNLLAATGPITLINCSVARRFLLNLLEERQFHLCVFMARKFYFNSVIRIEDLNFFMTSIRLALENGHSDPLTN
jgi:hypothetical protein